MKLDLTLPLTPEMVRNAPGNEQKSLTGHLGTHFDVMDRAFPLEYTERPGIVFDVSSIRDREIDCTDLPLDRVAGGSFVAFYTGFIEEYEYGTKVYFGTHPQLSVSLIEALLKKGVSIIGVDCGGIRRGAEHTPMDRHCAERGTFVVENLWNLKELLSWDTPFTVHTYPMNYTSISGLPCRVIAEKN